MSLLHLTNYRVRVARPLLLAASLACLAALGPAQVQQPGNRTLITLGEFESSMLESGASVRVNFFNFSAAWPCKWRVSVVDAQNPALEIFGEGGYAPAGTGASVEGPVEGVERIIGVVDVFFDRVDDEAPGNDPAELGQTPVVLASLEILDSTSRTAIWGTNGTAVLPFRYPPSTLTDELPIGSAAAAAPGKAILYPPITATEAQRIRLSASNALGTTSAKIRLLISDAQSGALVADSCSGCIIKFGNLPPYNEVFPGAKRTVQFGGSTLQTVVPIILVFYDGIDGEALEGPGLLPTLELEQKQDGRPVKWIGPFGGTGNHR